MEIQNPNRPIIKVFLRLYVLLITIGIAMLLIPQFSEYYFIPHIFGAGIFLAIAVLYFSGKKLMPQMKSLVNGERLIAKWKLDLNQTRKFAEAELKRRKEDALATAFALFFAGILIYVFQIRDITFVESLILGGCLAIFGYAMANMYFRSIYEKMYNAEATIYFGFDGILFNEEFHMWNKWGRSLENISFDQNSMLLLVSYYSRGSKGAPNRREVRIPVPVENIKDAERIVELFKADRTKIG